MQYSNKYFAVGDIHGCVLSLKALISDLNATFSDFENRTFVFLGDYTDRGPSSKDVVSFLLEFSKKQECIFIRGNHDLMLLNALQKDEWQDWMVNGGAKTILSYGGEKGK